MNVVCIYGVVLMKWFGLLSSGILCLAFGLENASGEIAVRVADVNPGPISSNLDFLTVFNNELYFSAKVNTATDELWKFDGINPPSLEIPFPGGGSGPGYLVVFNSELHFAYDGADGAGREPATRER